MKTIRRSTAFLALVVAPLLLLWAPRGAPNPAARSRYLAYIGTYTTKTASKGIYAFRYDADAGKLTPIGVAAETPDPSWVAIHPSGKYLYAVNESGKNSMVSAFALNPKSGELTLLNQLPALGEDPCYISFDRTGKYVFVANYTSGNVVVFPVGADGKLGAATASVRDEGALGPNKDRQDGPHAHWIEQSVTNTAVYVADLGIDRVLLYEFDITKGSLSSAPVHSDWAPRVKLDPSAKLAKGSGPRHAVISRNGLHMYVLGELQSTVTAFHMVGTDLFTPTSFQRISTLPKNFSGRNDAAEIALHPSGRFLYASNRGSDTIAVFNIERRGGRLGLTANVPTGGKEPRHFAIDPTGRYLLAANQNSNNIVVFRIDLKSGGLTPTEQVLEVPSPVCITFVAAE